MHVLLLYRSVLSLDAMDVSGEQQLDIDANLFKERLNLDGSPINPGSPEKHGNFSSSRIKIMQL